MSLKSSTHTLRWLKSMPRLRFYHDHKAEIDEYIEEGLRFAEEMRKQAGESPLVKRLKTPDEFIDRIEYLPL